MSIGWIYNGTLPSVEDESRYTAPPEEPSEKPWPEPEDYLPHDLPHDEPQPEQSETDKP